MGSGSEKRARCSKRVVAKGERETQGVEHAEHIPGLDCALWLRKIRRVIYRVATDVEMGL